MTVAVADAYVWGYPLVAVHRTRASHPGRGAGSLVARDRLSTAADRSVVAPNNDTLYASGWFDLRAGDVWIDVAPMDGPDRYWSVMLLDAYTDVSYVCRRLHGGGGTTVRVGYDPDALYEPEAGRAVLPMATPTLWVLARVLVDGPDDLHGARRSLAGIRARQATSAAAPPAPPAPPARAARRGAGPGDPWRDAAGLAAHEKTAVAWFDDLRDALASDPPAPWHPAPPPGLADLLAAPPPAADLAAGVAAGEARIATHGRGVDRTGNGWGTRSRGAAFGDDVTYRAAFARYSLAGHLPSENRAYSRVVDGRRSALLRFPPGGEPPVDAFWSLSLYGPDMFFVPNVLGRYSIGDRTPGLQREADGSLAVTIAHERPADPANWLPAPAGPCVLALRAYEGRPPVVDATWFPPDLAPPAARDGSAP